jgi:hypothetical protein
VELKRENGQRPNAILIGLQDGRTLYNGTVPSNVRARRRAANRVAKQSRKANR